MIKVFVNDILKIFNIDNTQLNITAITNIEDYTNRDKWNQMAIHNVARIGYFSSDRAVMDYAKNIWHIKPVD